MSSNHNIAPPVNHAFDFELLLDRAVGKDTAQMSILESESQDALVSLRQACIAARAVLCETILSECFNHVSAAGAISSINTALVRSSFLD